MTTRDATPRALIGAVEACYAVEKELRRLARRRAPAAGRKATIEKFPAITRRPSEK